ncbi:MAG TPA: GAF domain-containing protein [Cytophagaceae bacterium]|nr:GAF domain-containing protein [Cytophagaceae bacterium]
MIYSINRISNYTSTRRVTQELNIYLLQMRRAEKDFILQELTNESFFETGHSKYIVKFDELYQLASNHMETLVESDAIGQLNYVDSIKIAQKYLQEYSTIFHKMTDSYKTKGYKNWGHEGELREAIHSIENGKENYDKVLMLTLRRHEKDFLLRKDLDYVTKFDKTIAEFKASLSGDLNKELLLAIESYEKEFHKVVEAENKIGLTSENGLKYDLRSIVHKMESLLERVQKMMVIHVQSVISNTYILLIVLFLIQLVIAIILALSFSNSTTHSIQTIKDRISKLSEGMFPEKIIPATEDEMGEASRSLNNLIDRIQTAADFSGKIGGGELNIEYDKNFNNDVLANSLQSMHQKLKEAAEDSRKRNWITTGLAHFGEILRRSDSDLHQLCQNIISNLVKYMETNQGQLYIVKEKTTVEEEHLELMATYAWGRTKFENKTIYKGEGLAGQVWIEKQTTYITEIPENYVKITSGLGQALPNSILIVPLKANDEIFGIVEIASFNKMENYKIELVEKLAEVVASTLSSVQINTRTKELLFESQQQAEELRAQEEEMRQNTEEMQATQEELQRQKIEMDNKINALEEELARYKSNGSNNKINHSNFVTLI